MTAMAYERILEKLREQGKKVRLDRSGKSARAQCPHLDHNQAYSLAVYTKAAKARLVCYAGCDDALDVLPALGLTVADLYDGPRTRSYAPDPQTQALMAQMRARQEARRIMTPSQRALDDLLQLPDIGERLCNAIARMRPELYIAEREQLAGESNG